MHEMSLAESVREIVDETARANGARRVAAVRLEIGALAQVEVEAMRFAFDVVKRGSLADGARLGHAQAVAGSREFMSGLVLFHTEWTDLQVTPLGPETAIASFVFRDSIVTRAGALIRARGPTTLVWQRRGGEWRVLFADADHYPIDP